MGDDAPRPDNSVIPNSNARQNGNSRPDPYSITNLVAEAAKRGHEVVAYSRRTPESPVPGVE